MSHIETETPRRAIHRATNQLGWARLLTNSPHMSHFVSLRKTWIPSPLEWDSATTIPNSMLVDVQSRADSVALRTCPICKFGDVEVEYGFFDTSGHPQTWDTSANGGTCPRCKFPVKTDDVGNVKEVSHRDYPTINVRGAVDVSKDGSLIVTADSGDLKEVQSLVNTLYDVIREFASDKYTSESFNAELERIFPNLTEEQYDTLLWSCTPFPAGTPEQIMERLQWYAGKSNGDFDTAMKISTEEMDSAMSEINENESIKKDISVSS